VLKPYIASCIFEAMHGFRFYTLLFLCCYSLLLSSQNTSPTYAGIIATFDSLAKTSPFAELKVAGTTDVGKPLHLFVLSADKIFDPAKAKQAGKLVLLINNGIHPGEPDGIDACIRLSREWCKNPKSLPKDVVICIVPVFNVDGALNRNKTSRSNQNGPEEYGFRGNARNLDLNRDFTKCDAANTRSLVTTFTAWDPDVFVDTHVSDGADYQYTMTLIATHHQKLNPAAGRFLKNEMLPVLYRDMEQRGQRMAPYVETLGRTPESGIVGFMDTPRYSSGYAALFNTFGFVTETHMWKPFADRVNATVDFLNVLISYSSLHTGAIRAARKQANEEMMKEKMVLYNWQLDTTRYDTLLFHGYKAVYSASNISGKERLMYDKTQPVTFTVKHFNYYNVGDSSAIPDYYIIPQAWHEVVARLQLNGVAMKRLVRDTVISFSASRIKSYSTVRQPYESHYMHYDTEVEDVKYSMHLYAGDYIVSTQQRARKYLVTVMEPKSNDSFWAWNFFDGITSQKEWFSDYIFEEKAEQMVLSNPILKAQLDSAKQDDAKLREDHWLQLNFIYQRSEFKEPSHNIYPVVRWIGTLPVSLK
jgi:hypothetical protein